MNEERIRLGGLDAISVGDREAARVVAVVLHGFQMEPGDLSPFAHSMQAPAWFLFPEAPLNAEGRGRAWWHIDARLRDEALKRGPRDFAPQHPVDLPRARGLLSAFVAAAREAAPGKRLVVAGFSQGGMLTCDTFLRGELSADALALLSASRIAFDEWTPHLDRLRGLPVLVSHGDGDPDLAFSAGEALRDCLVGAGAQVTWLPFGGGHEIPLVVWRSLRKLLLARE
jgi:phospholipase/carboxylesterase